MATVSRCDADALHCAAGCKFCSSCCRCHHFAAHDDARGGRPHALNTHATTLVLKYVVHHNHCRGGFEYDTDLSHEWGPCAPQLLPNEGSQALLEGVHWRSLASNFADFDDFGLNFVNFSCAQQSHSSKTNAADDHF